jgi:hypothetical protein
MSSRNIFSSYAKNLFTDTYINNYFATHPDITKFISYKIWPNVLLCDEYKYVEKDLFK